MEINKVSHIVIPKAIEVALNCEKKYTYTRREMAKSDFFFLLQIQVSKVLRLVKGFYHMNNYLLSFSKMKCDDNWQEMYWQLRFDS